MTDAPDYPPELVEAMARGLVQALLPGVRWGPVWMIYADAARAALDAAETAGFALLQPPRMESVDGMDVADILRGQAHAEMASAAAAPEPHVPGVAPHTLPYVAYLLAAHGEASSILSPQRDFLAAATAGPFRMWKTEAGVEVELPGDQRRILWRFDDSLLDARGAGVDEVRIYVGQQRHVLSCRYGAAKPSPRPDDAAEAPKPPQAALRPNGDPPTQIVVECVSRRGDRWNWVIFGADVLLAEGHASTPRAACLAAGDALSDDTSHRPAKYAPDVMK